MPIDPFAAGALPALPPDIYNLEWLSRVNGIAEALVYSAAAVLCVMVVARRSRRA